MRTTEKATFLSADHLEEQAASRIREAEQMRPGEAQENARRNAAQLRNYADIKRRLVPGRMTPAARAGS